jgi:serine protease AprX
MKRTPGGAVRILSFSLLGKSVYLLAAGLLFNVAGASPAVNSLIQKGDSALAQMRPEGAGWTSVIAQVDDEPTGKPVTSLAALHADVYRHLPLIHSVALRVPTRNLEALAELPFVRHLTLDARVHKNDTFTVDSSGAATAWSQYGLTGAGVTVAVVDSGIAPHPDLNGAVLASVDVTGDNTTADLCGHGTHVAGIIAGSGAASSVPGSFQTFYGIAPQAKLVSVRVLHADGSSDVSTVVSGIQWVINNRARYNIRILNLSLGEGVAQSYLTDPLCQAVEAAWKSGIFVACAAGNSGRLYNQANPLLPSELPILDSSNLPVVNEGYVTNYGSIESPGNDPYVITVGAMKSTDGNRADDHVTTYSSRGPALVDQTLKPDIVAPGNLVISLLSPGSYLDALEGATAEVPPSAYITSPPSGTPVEYFTLSGTSMATPVVCGAAALMLQANPQLTPDTLKARLMVSADKWTYALGLGDAMTFGAGYINIPAALQSTVTATQWALSPGMSLDILGVLVVVDGNHAIWGKAGIWGSSQLQSMTSIYGSHAIWGKNTLANSSAISGNHAIWGKSAPGSSSTLGMSAVGVKGER